MYFLEMKYIVQNIIFYVFFKYIYTFKIYFYLKNDPKNIY